MKLPSVPLDAQDRRIVGRAVVISTAVMLLVILVAVTAGIGVRAFLWTSGLGG
jgi:hypothetical protein